MKLQSIKPLQTSKRKLQKKTKSSAIEKSTNHESSSSRKPKQKKKSSQTSAVCEPWETLDPMDVASKANVLAHSLDYQGNDSKRSNKKGTQQLKQLFRRKQTESIESTKSVGTEGTDTSSSPESSSNNNNNKNKVVTEKVQRVKKLAKEQCSVAVEKTAATSKRVSQLAKEQCAVAAEKTTAKTAETRETMKRVKDRAQVQCSVASKKTIVKITDLIKSSRSNNKKEKHMLTTTETSHQDGVEISLASLPLSVQNERFKHLRRAAGKRYAKVAQKLTSLRKSGEDDPNGDHELSPLESDRHRVQQECPICLDPMSEHDLCHPLQCKTPQCQYNFCAACISNLIHSSQDAYALASDGSNQVKVHLTCPNCRDDLTHSLKKTLLLRLADDTTSHAQRTNQMMELVADHLPFQNQASSLNDKQKLMQLDHLDMEIYRARAQERDFKSNQQEKKKPSKPKRKSSRRSSRRSSRAAALEPTPALSSRVDSGIVQEEVQAPLSYKHHRSLADEDDEDLHRDILAHGNLRFKRESSFPVNQSTCFYIDTQVNLGGKNPARLRFQM